MNKLYPVTNPFKNAVYSPSRQSKAKARFEIIDVDAFPDATASVNAESEFSKHDQVVNIRRETSAKYATLEKDYWKLDGSFCLPPKAAESGYEVGWWSEELSIGDSITYVTEKFKEIVGESNIKRMIFFDPTTGTTLTDKMGLGNATLSKDASNLNPDLAGSASILNFDASDEYWDFPDSNDLSFGSGGTDSPFSLVWCGKPVFDSSLRALISKDDRRSNIEYAFQITDTNLIAFTLFNLTDAAAFIQKRYATTISGDSSAYHNYIGTYNGSKSATGIKIYRDGTRVDDTTLTSGVYAGMSNGAAKAGNYYIDSGGTRGRVGQGKFAFVAIVSIELSASQATQINSLISSFVANTSYGISEFLNSQDVTCQFTQDHSSIGITVTFDTLSDEYAEDFTIKAYDSGNNLIKTATVTGNTLSMYKCEEAFSNYRKIVLTITKWKAGYRRARVLELDFGIVQEYTDEDIVKLDVLEELDPISSTVSANEVKLTLYNRNKDFNILNPDGIYPYLQRRQKIVPQIGVVITDTLTEYVPMGVYYLNEWKSDEGTLTATFTARDILDILSQSTYRKGKYQTRSLYDLAVDVLTDAAVTDYVVDTALQSISVVGCIPLVTHREALQLIAFAGQCALYSDRDGYIQIKRLSDTPLSETIDFDNVYSSPTIKLDKLINTVDVSVNKYVAKASSEEVYNGTIAINGTVDVWIEYKSSPCQSISSVVTGGTVNSETYYGNAALLNITAAGNVTIVSTGTVLEKASTVYQLKDGTAPSDEQPLAVKIDNVLISDNSIAGDVATWVLAEYGKRFLYDINWRQNPAYEAGDIVTVEDEFGENKTVRVAKQAFEYQGYLAGKTEGRAG